MTNSTPKLPYTYEFDKEELEAIRACNEQHGFAVVKDLLPQNLVEKLKTEVLQTLEQACDSRPGTTHFSTNFVELSPTLFSLLTYEPYMKIVRHLYGNAPISLNRSAAIYKKPGAAVGAWHTDWEPKIHPYRCNAVLNTTGASSNWFYLNGTHPERAGIAIIPDSHTEEWVAPEGFDFTANRKSFYRLGTEPKDCLEMDFEGVFSLYTEPGDLIIFAERTYHGVHAHNGNEARLSCALSFRTKGQDFSECWPLPESAQHFISSCSPEVKSLVEEYLGIDTGWVSTN
ncbi:phytanoyl-CoA dioxygenase family protein [Paenibacillus eucommiae]|uniref:Ectoine hydroxylase-related dioxygenase (Phytanoyl-CoA dioxygenase family) n=1 Tax=Paenibacillus eucommiae TaxID=1355755 RepID=A0ABS4J1I3_9BACL|nr:phytanoyl-CoA dioxygenase family protein [Paenibacillus eucommiae]MBP1993658.1 ectoine hydroxylase-related dioxygenase (phytanoyl-CoA dioxygenase family) [Paenibacillus eucommiae]